MEIVTTFFEDVVKTSLRRLETSRLFPVRANDHLDTIYGLYIYVRFKLLSYYHPITRQNNRINLNKINALKHGNSIKIMKTWFSMNYQASILLINTFTKCFSLEFKYIQRWSFAYSSVVKLTTL